MASNLAQFLGKEVYRVLDVGARYNFHSLFLPVAAQTEMTGFEPDEEECKRLNGGTQPSPWRSARALPYAVGENGRARPFYITEHPGMSSLLRPNCALIQASDARILRETTVDTVSLDELWTRGELAGDYDFIKLDTQGSELEILQSGEAHLLPRTLGIQTEALFLEGYVGQPRFSEIDRYLHGLGFELVFLEANHLRRKELLYTRGRLYEGEWIFLRGESWLAAQPEEGRCRVLRKLAVLYMLYGLFGEAVALLEPYDRDLAAHVQTYYHSVARHNWRWRLALLVESVRCAADPSPKNRIAVSKRSLAMRGPDGVHWRIR
jgi:FkbM family methyltransferase